jgi:oligoribonuclease (3'-5' exoribonuclease)
MAKTIYNILSTDFETFGFNGVQTNAKGKVILNPDGSPRIGAGYYGIAETCFRLLTPELELIDEVHCYIRLPQHIIDRSDPSTIAFHQQVNVPGKPSFWSIYDALRSGGGKFIDMDRDGFEIIHLTIGDWTETVKLAESVRQVQEAVINMLRRHLGDNMQQYKYGNSHQTQIMGKSIGFDLSFIQHQMPMLSTYICHQPLDMSVFKTAPRLWNGSYYIQPSQSTHNAKDDCLAHEADAAVMRDYYKALPYSKYQVTVLRNIQKLLKSRAARLLNAIDAFKREL